MLINSQRTVGELAAAIPGATRIFEQLGIDYCCRGGLAISEACESASVQLDDVLHLLVKAATDSHSGYTNRTWVAEPLSQLITHIVESHHAFTRSELSRLELLVDKVASHHATNHPELLELRPVFHRLKEELIPHMLKEEQVLFPYVTRLEASLNSGQPVQQPFFATVRNPVRMMMTEHDAAGELLSKLRRITNEYKVPDDGCLSYEALYRALPELEADLHQHIHLENNILFPRAIELEAPAERNWKVEPWQVGKHHCLSE